MRRAAGVVLLGVLSAAVVRAQTFAVFSPEAVKKIAAQKDTAAGQKFLRDAGGELNDAPHPMERVHTQGTLPGEGIRDESVAAERDWDKMLNFAMAYRLTGEHKYLDAADKFLAAWVGMYKPSFDPIDETRLDMVVLTFDLTRGSLKPATEQTALAWMRTLSEGYVTWMERNAAKDAFNFSSHRTKLAVLGAYETGDAKLIARAARVFHTQVAQNVRKDGSVEDFYKRDALHYVVYDLEPLETAALAAQGHGERWFNESVDGRVLSHAVDWLVPYETGAKKHDEFVHSTVAFDAKRDKAGEKGYSGPWDPANGVNAVALAFLLDPRFAAPLRETVTLTRRKPAGWMLVYSEAHAGPALK